VSAQPGGTEPQLGSMATAVSELLLNGVLLGGGVGVPVASGMAGSGVLVGVALRLASAWATGEGKIWRCKLSSWANSRANSRVNNTPLVTSK
jgi:hypothetical protein